MTIYCAINNQYYLDVVTPPKGAEYAKCVALLKEYHPTTPLYTIVGPTGGYANYVGWLAFLDPKFSLVNKTDADMYTNFAGADWPLHHDYVLDNFTNTNPMVVEEIKQLFTSDYKLDTIASKLEFLADKIFPKSRTWHNWITCEWEYRIPIKTILEIDHEFIPDPAHPRKTILLTIDPELAYKSYLKFNSNLTYQSKIDFVDYIARINAEHNSIDHPNVLAVDSSILYQPTLDRNWYSTLINWLGLEDNYPAACVVHELWYSAHKRAEQEIIKDLMDLYS